MKRIDELAEKFNIFDKDMKLFTEAIRFLNVSTIRVTDNKAVSLHKELNPDLDLRSIVHDPIKMLITDDHIREIYEETEAVMQELIKDVHGSDDYSAKIMQTFLDLSPDEQKDAFSQCLMAASENLFRLPAQEEDVYEPAGHHIN